jgi:hypothetical protein
MPFPSPWGGREISGRASNVATLVVAVPLIFVPKKRGKWIMSVDVAFLREYLAREFPEAQISDHYDFDRMSHGFRVDLPNATYLVRVSKEWMDDSLPEEAGDFLDANRVAARLRENPGRILVVTTSGCHLEKRVRLNEPRRT